MTIVERECSVFGPVASGRLGRSLGLDLLSRNICTLDCLYCEVGRTERLTLERKEWVPAQTVLQELAYWREAHAGLPDYVTLGGSGEPCLNTGAPEIIAGARRLLPGVPVAVLTNATLFTDPAVRKEMAGTDVVLPSMDSLLEDEFKQLNRPHPDISLHNIAAGLLQFREEFSGRIFLETLLTAGVNDSEENLERMRDYVRRLRPERVDVVTMSRPGAYETARPVSEAALRRWREALGQKGGNASQRMPAQAGNCSGDLAHEVLQSLRRRPQTAEQLALALSAEPAHVKKILERLQEDGHIQAHGEDDSDFFRATHTRA